MAIHFEEQPGLTVTVDQVIHQPQLHAPQERPHAFAYFLSIHNDSEEAVTIVGRKWIVTDEGGGTLVVEGDGVVGQTPRLEPGQTFSYNSYHVISEPSKATGTFFGHTETGKPVYVRIPDFRMELGE